MSRRKEGPPSTLRRGHGFKEARAAGAPYVKPRTGWQMDSDVQWRHAEKEVRKLVERDKSIEPLVRELIADQKKRNSYNAHELLFEVLWNRPDLAPPSYWESVPLYARPPQLK